MSVAAKMIVSLEKMTKLSLNETEQETMKEYLSHCIERFDIIDAIDTTETEPLISVADLKNILREDISYQMVTRDELFENAVEENNGYFQVPKTID